MVLLVAACGGSSSSASPTVVSQSAGFEAQIASDDLAVGVNRFTFGLLDNNTPVKDGTARVIFFAREGNRAVRMGSDTAFFSSFTHGLKRTPANQEAFVLGGVFVTYARFSRPGDWGAEILYRYHGVLHTLRAGFTVAARSLSPELGSPAPPSNNPTTYQKPATRLDSGRPPDDMHRLSIRQALAQHKPLVVLFSTPAFCTSRLCGPETQQVELLERQFRGSANFIHIEIYQNANPQDGYAPTVLQWRLQSEPWVFVVNRRGIIVAKFEGPTPADEIRPVIARLIH